MIWQIISIIDLLLFIMVGYTVLYFTVFGFASLFYSKFKAPGSRRRARFLVLVPCFNADDYFQQTLDALEAQQYDRRMFDILVVSSHNKPITNMKLAQHNLALHIMPNDETYNDVRSWQFGIEHAQALRIYDMVVIIEADETMEDTYLSEINEAAQLGAKAIQTHRTYASRNTPTEIMLATFEEINSSIFRMGHVALGLSSGLIGSGMAFEYRWFRENIGRLPLGSDLKSFEAMVLSAGKYIDFLDDTRFYSKPRSKQDSSKVIDRSGWMYAQWDALRSHLKDLPKALIRHNIDLVDKIMQWMLMPRIAMMAIIVVMCVVTPFFWWSMSLKWLITGAWIMLVFAIATPDYLIDRQWEKAFIYAPRLMLKTLFYVLPSGWVLTFTRNHKDEWAEDLRQRGEQISRLRRSRKEPQPDSREEEATQ